MTQQENASEHRYQYADYVRPDIVRMIPADGQVIGSIGCGRAAVEATLMQAGRQVHGVDISEEAIACAKSRLTSARVIAPDDLAPFAPESLDGLLLADVIEHVPHAPKALQAYVRAVRPGGWVAISVPNMRGRHVFWEFIIKGDWPEHESGIFDATHIQVMSKRRLQRWCTQAGLTVERWFSLYSPYGPRRDAAIKLMDYASLGLLHTWLLYAIQGVFRKPPVHK